MTLNWKATKEEHDLITLIAMRAEQIAKRAGFAVTRAELIMDLNATHSNGTALDLARLYAADDTNFIHDVFGIRRHLNRDTGKLENCFVPRFARGGVA